jgi:hypothetical protein
MQSSFSLDKLRRFLTGDHRRNTHIDPGADAEHDLSYEDVLLDLQLRQYFKAEYGVSEPPARVFPRLMSAIQAHERGRVTPEASRPVAAFVAIYRVLRTTTAHRLVSGGIAAALMIAILSSNSAHFLTGTAVSFVREEATPTTNTPITGQIAFTIATERDNRYLSHVPITGNDPEFYDPAERRMPARDASASGSSTPALWLRMGGQ